MQLDKIVAYHKAMADPTRIRMLVLLAKGELSGQALAEKLHVSPATVTHHASKLRQASLIRERRDKNTIYFKLNDYFIASYAVAARDVIYRNATADEAPEEGATVTNAERNAKLRESVLRNFFTTDGRLKHIPAQLKKKLIALGSMASLLEKGRSYSEAEINDFIRGFHEDFATIRREFVMHQFMYRENDRYELNPVELWTKWETLR